MKSYFPALFFFLFCCSTHLSAQDYKHSFTLNAGGSAVGFLINLADDLSGPDDDLNTRSIPAIQFAYDYHVNNWFSIGPALSYQNFGIQISDLTYTNSDGNTVTEDADLSINRFNLAVRPLFHYGKKLDLYSGFRIGATQLGIKNNSSGDSVEDTNDELNAFRPGLGVQVVLFGLRGYFNNNFGLNFEIGVGAPHFISTGINYRM